MNDYSLIDKGENRTLATSFTKVRCGPFTSYQGEQRPDFAKPAMGGGFNWSTQHFNL